MNKTGDPMEGAAYSEGYTAGLGSKPWSTVPYTPGTRSFHLYLEGHADGLKARILQKPATTTSTHV
jgi:ribosome modulation factor